MSDLGFLLCGTAIRRDHLAALASAAVSLPSPLLYLPGHRARGERKAQSDGQAMQIAVATSALVMLCSRRCWRPGRHLRAGTPQLALACWADAQPASPSAASPARSLALEVSGEWIRWLFVIVPGWQPLPIATFAPDL